MNFLNDIISKTALIVINLNVTSIRKTPINQKFLFNKIEFPCTQIQSLVRTQHMRAREHKNAHTTLTDTRIRARMLQRTHANIKHTHAGKMSAQT